MPCCIDDLAPCRNVAGERLSGDQQRRRSRAGRRPAHPIRDIVSAIAVVGRNAPSMQRLPSPINSLVGKVRSLQGHIKHFNKDVRAGKDDDDQPMQRSTDASIPCKSRAWAPLGQSVRPRACFPPLTLIADQSRKASLAGSWRLEGEGSSGMCRDRQF